MTRQKSFKTGVRARMEKTGESYTAARRQFVAKHDEAHTADAPADTKAAGRGDGINALRLPAETVRERTGRVPDEWFALLDGWGATERTHPEIVRWLVEEHRVPGWWAQNITVSYEQARGKRLPGQGPDGYFSASGSKTVSVPVDRLYEAFADARLRERWLPGVALMVSTARAPKSFRAAWEDGTRLVAGFYARGDAKSMVGVAHEKLPDADSAARMKTFWRERLAALKHVLES